jgi:hypothetical protein
VRLCVCLLQDMRQIRCLVKDECEGGFLAAMRVHGFPARLDGTFAFDFTPVAIAQVPLALQQSLLYTPAGELTRLRLEVGGQWAVRPWNVDYVVCQGYAQQRHREREKWTEQL